MRTLGSPWAGERGSSSPRAVAGAWFRPCGQNAFCCPPPPGSFGPGAASQLLQETTNLCWFWYRGRAGIDAQGPGGTEPAPLLGLVNVHPWTGAMHTPIPPLAHWHWCPSSCSGCRGLSMAGYAAGKPTPSGGIPLLPPNLPPPLGTVFPGSAWLQMGRQGVSCARLPVPPGTGLRHNALTTASSQLGAHTGSGTRETCSHSSLGHMLG